MTLKYEDNKIVGVDAVVLSTQHSEEVSQKEIYEGVMEEIIVNFANRMVISTNEIFH